MEAWTSFAILVHTPLSLHLGVSAYGNLNLVKNQRQKDTVLFKVDMCLNVTSIVFPLLHFLCKAGCISRKTAAIFVEREYGKLSTKTFIITKNLGAKRGR